MRVAVQDVAMSVPGRQLFRGLNFQARAGEVIAVMGPSGMGKSTLLAGIAGILPLDNGEVVFGQEVHKHSVHWVFQTTNLLPKRSALDNVALMGELRGLSRSDSLSLAQSALDKVGLAERSRECAFKLSGGEKQRVAVARAIASNAPVILADEPTASLDTHSRESVTSALLGAAEAGSCVIVATHDHWVAQQCTRIIDLGAL